MNLICLECSGGFVILPVLFINIRQLIEMRKTPYRLLSENDLSETQVFVTMQTYDRFADTYAEKWEWRAKTVQEVKKYNIKPFTKYAQKGCKVLIVGCQSGRDYTLLTEEGFRCLGTSFSYGLLTEALKRVPNGMFVHLDPRSLPFLPESFDAVYADALTYIPRSDLPGALRDFRIFLKPGGVLYLSLKLGKKRVYVVQDIGGPRYLTLFRKQEIVTMVEAAGFHLVWSETSPHTEARLPKWFSLVAEK